VDYIRYNRRVGNALYFSFLPSLLLPYSSKKLTFEHPAFCRAKRAKTTTAKNTTK